MPIDFDTALKGALEKVNQGFEEADRDLHELVADLAKSTAKLTGGKVKSYLQRISESESGVGYALQVEGHGRTVTIVYLEVPVRGYPILISEQHPAAKAAATDFKNRAELVRFFQDIATNPDSAFVTTLAYFMRSIQRTSKGFRRLPISLEPMRP